MESLFNKVAGLQAGIPEKWDPRPRTRDPPHGILHLERLGGTRAPDLYVEPGTWFPPPATQDPICGTPGTKVRNPVLFIRAQFCIVLNHLMLKLQLTLRQDKNK